MRSMTFGKYLRERRNAVGKSQTELAADLGLTQPTISLYENDERLPPLEVVHKLIRTCRMNAAKTLRLAAARKASTAA